MLGTKTAKPAGIGRIVRKYGRGETVFVAGDTCDDVFYIQTGGVKLSMWSLAGREAVIGTLGAGDFFGDGCLTGQRIRLGSATAIAPSVIRVVDRARMVRLLQTKPAVSRKFTANLLSRTMRIEEDLKNQIFLQKDTKGLS